VSRRVTALCVLCLLVAAACGQKSGVHVAVSGGGGNEPAASPGTTAPKTQTTVGKGPNDTAGVTDSEIRIGVHAPLPSARSTAAP
jgi:hypothetical protein